MKPARVIAETGCNHKGQIDIAKDMIVTASIFCKVDIVKFQKRNPRELLSEEEYNAPHHNPAHSYGKTYGEHREFLEFDLEQHKTLKKWCEKNNLEYSTSVWDLTSTKEIISLNPNLIKVPSACNLNKAILKELSTNFKGKIHISLGMTDSEEQEKIVTFFEDQKRASDLVIYACTSGYPVPFEDICLLEIVNIKERFGKRIDAVGFSGHHLGIAADIAALILGAEYIERHYTLDRTWKGTDHSASLEPDGLRRLCRDIRNVSKAIEYKKDAILDVEKVQREKLKKNQINWT